MLRLNLCDNSDVYVVVKGAIVYWLLTVDYCKLFIQYWWLDRCIKNAQAEKEVACKNNAPFRLCILKIKNMLTENAEDLDIVIPMHNLLEYSHNCSMNNISIPI